MLRHRFTPRCPRLEHRIQDHEQLAHARRQRQLLRLARLTQALIERLDGRVVVGRHKGGHIQGRASLRAAAPDRAFARGSRGGVRHEY